MAGSRQTANGVVQTANGVVQTVGGSSTTIIDDFEGANPLSNYQGDTGGFSIVSSPTYNGSNALQHDGNGTFDEMFSVPGDGLSQYFPKGTRAEYYNQIGGLEDQWSLWFGVTDKDNCYRIEIEASTDDIDLVSLNGGSSTSLASTSDGTVGYQTGRWYRYEVTRGDGATFGLSDNDIQLVVEDMSDNSTVWDVTVNNADHASAEGIGFRNGGPSAAAWTDYLRLTGGL